MDDQSELASSLMSKKLIATALTQLCATAAVLFDKMDGLHYAIVVGAVGVTYVGGQALIDAVGKFAQAKFAK